ncbi:MAG: type II toxin-antitoxin system prevent-host-death family antitoxin [Trueperaceae bacterium]
MDALELSHDTMRVLERVESGEEVVITVEGRPVARLIKVPENPRWVSRDELFSWLATGSADAGLRRDLDELVPEMLDDRDIR